MRNLCKPVNFVIECWLLSLLNVPTTKWTDKTKDICFYKVTACTTYVIKNEYLLKPLENKVIDTRPRGGKNTSQALKALRVINNGGFAQQTYQQIKEHEIADKSMRHSCHPLRQSGCGPVWSSRQTRLRTRRGSKEDAFMRDKLLREILVQLFLVGWTLTILGRAKELTGITTEIVCDETIHERT